MQDVRDELEAARHRIGDLEDLVKSAEEENGQLKGTNWDLSQKISCMNLDDKKNFAMYQKALREKAELTKRADELDAQVKY